jgi:hypothetical protein
MVSFQSPQILEGSLHNTYLDLGEVLRKIEEEKERRRA